MAANVRRGQLATAALLLLAFVLGVGARQLVFDIDFERPTAITIDPVVVRVHTSAQVSETRQALIQYVFDREDLPGDLPTEGGDGTFIVQMQNGLTSIVRLNRPESPNGRLAIYHAGHAAYGETDQPMVDQLLADGYAVLVFDMPLIGVNAAQVSVLRENGAVTVSRHDQMAYLDPVTDGSPIRYFLEPIVIMLNQFEAKYSEVAMVGLSGGAWTTTLAAALDPRIDRSYPAAGSLPLAVGFAVEESWGDWEQTVPDLYEIAGYEDLYVMGADDRRQMQVLNEHDPCCFGGDYRSYYVPQVQAAVAALGSGSFDVFLDSENRQHSIGSRSIDAIISDLSNQPGS